MATIGDVPPPPPNKLADISVNFICATAVFQTLSIVAVVFRFLSRRLMHAVGLDDWASLAALVFSFGNTAAIVFAAVLGRGGFHEASLTYVQLGIFLEGVLVYNLTLICSTTCAKIALLWFFRRVFPIRSMKRLVWIFIALALVAYWLIGCCLVLFINDPIESQWKPWIVPRRKLGLKYVFGYICIADMMVDIGILCLPQRQVWKLHVSLRRRTLISMLLLLGVFTCALAVVRFVYVILLGSDFSYEIVRAGPWGTVETHLSIIVGCAPMFPKLFRHWFVGKKSSASIAGSVSTHGDRALSRTWQQETKSKEPAKISPEIPSDNGQQAKDRVYIQLDFEVDHIERRNDDNKNDSGQEYGWMPKYQ